MGLAEGGGLRSEDGPKGKEKVASSEVSELLEDVDCSLDRFVETDLVRYLEFRRHEAETELKDPDLVDEFLDAIVDKFLRENELKMSNLADYMLVVEMLRVGSKTTNDLKQENFYKKFIDSILKKFVAVLETYHGIDWEGVDKLKAALDKRDPLSLDRDTDNIDMTVDRINTWLQKFGFGLSSHATTTLMIAEYIRRNENQVAAVLGGEGWNDDLETRLEVRKKAREEAAREKAEKEARKARGA